MPPKRSNIPLNVLADDFSLGISVDRNEIGRADFVSAVQYNEATQAHRDEGHTFHFLERGSVLIEIDFHEYRIKAPCLVYMHPNQVHRILDFKHITVCSLAITNAQLHTGYAELLDRIAPAQPLKPSKAAVTMLGDIFALCLRLDAQKENKLHPALLKDSCNTLVAYVASLFMEQGKKDEALSRYSQITQSFQQLLDKKYIQLKRPADYAQLLHVSVTYLNECVRNTTGLPASQQIRDRVLLEAKRLLYHTDKTVKEIAFGLGYTDHAYFSRLFAKATGMSALAFRNKNRV